MAATLQELRDTRVDCVKKARDCQLRMEKEGKKEVTSWTDNERDEFNALMKGADDAELTYKKALGDSQAVDRLAQYEESFDRKEEDRNRLTLPGDNKYMAAQINWLSKNKSVPRAWNKSKVHGSDEYNQHFNAYLRGSDVSKAWLASTGMSSDNEERGGIFQTSEIFMTEVIKNVDDAVFVQNLSRVIMMPAARSLGARVRRQRASTFQWAGENTDTTPTLDTSLMYGKRLITPNYLQGSTIISRDLLRNVPSSEGMVINEIGIDLGYKLEPAFLTGDGNFKPLGLLTASTDGISSGRDVPSGLTAFTFDDWVALKYSLKTQYRNKAKIMCHRLVLQQTSLLKDGEGRYMWEPSRQINAPDVILGTEVIETEWMPYVASSGNYFAIIGDFSWYWIVYEMNMEMQRLVEVRAHTNEFEYLFRCKLDAQPMLEEAFSRGKRA